MRFFKPLFMSVVSFLLTGCPGITAATENADFETRQQMINNLSTMRNTFDVMYAPAGWKKALIGWDLNDEYNKAKQEILGRNTLTVKDYQRIVKSFFNSMNDYHVSVFFYSTESAYLPFKIKGVNGRYFITYIDRQKLSSKVYPFNLGDELMTFDGRPTDEVIKALRSEELRQGNPETDQSIAEMFLTVREGRLGLDVPSGPVSITVRSSETDSVRSYQLIWNYTPEEIVNHRPAGILSALNLRSKPELSKKEFFEKMMISYLYPAFFDENDNDVITRDDLGSRESFIPDLGTKWWESSDDCPFYAYIFENAQSKRIGYVRIPHYIGWEDNVEEFGKILKKFEDRTDALVIDQVNNPGGIVFYLYALASMLTDQPLITPKHRIKLTQQEVAFSVMVLKELEKVHSDADAQQVLGETLIGYPVTYQVAQFFIDFCRFIIDEWNQGKSFTDPIHFFGVDHINPHPQYRYTKPILLLINHLDFSGGDFFPAIMQDNQRVTILGTRTAGAGGAVMGQQFSNPFGISYYRCTYTIAERTNKVYIENVGVSPDIEYKLTENDLQTDYSDYVEAINKAIDTITY